MSTYEQLESYIVPTIQHEGKKYVEWEEVLKYVNWREQVLLKSQERSGTTFLPDK